MYASPSRITDELCDATVRCEDLILHMRVSQQPVASFTDTTNFNPTMDK